MKADCGCAWEIKVDDKHGSAVHHERCHHIGTMRYSRLKLYPKAELAG